MTKTKLIALCLLSSVAVSPVAFGAGDENAPAAKQEKLYNDAQRLIKEKDYPKAIAFLEKLLKDRPNDADVYNLLGYSYRKKGDKEEGMNHYKKALAIKPDHVGALEYQGELFLELNQLKSAQTNLAAIEKACGKNCKEYKMLVGSIEDFKKAGGAQYVSKY